MLRYWLFRKIVEEYSLVRYSAKQVENLCELLAVIIFCVGMDWYFYLD